MKTLGTLAAVIVIAILLLFSMNQCGRPVATEAVGMAPVSYDGAVYYFESVQSFGSDLAAFIKSHPDLRVVSVAPLDNNPYGSTRGYWVVVEKRQPEITK